MIVVDTHAWIWWLAGSPDLSEVARDALDSAAEVGIPSVCCWEVAWLNRRGRIEAEDGALAWMRAALATRGVRLLPLLPEIAAMGAGFGAQLTGDPADRQIVATALLHDAPLVTCDGPITRSELVRTIW